MKFAGKKAISLLVLTSHKYSTQLYDILIIMLKLEREEKIADIYDAQILNRLLVVHKGVTKTNQVYIPQHPLLNLRGN